MKARPLIILFAFMQLCVAFLTDAQTFTHEESMWHYIGRNWFRHGLTPYSGGVDNKSPLIFALYGLSDALFGLNYWFPRLVGVAVQSIGIYFVYRITFRLMKDIRNPPAGDYSYANNSALIAMTIYGLSLMWRATGGKYVSFTETYAITLIIMAVYRYLVATGNKQFFIAGLIAGVAAGWRLSAGFSIAAILVHALAKNRSAVLPFIAGLVSSIALLILLAVTAGIRLTDLWVFAFVGNFGAGSTTDHSIEWRMKSLAENFFYSELLLFLPVIAAWCLVKKRFTLITCWFVFEFIGINLLGIYARPHFKSILPALAIMGGISIVQLVWHYKISMKKILIAVWIIFFPKLIEPFIALKKLITKEKGVQIDYCNDALSRTNEQAEKQLGLWIRDHSKITDKIFVAGFGARVQLYSERIAPTIYFNVTQTPKAKKEFMQQMLSGKPDLIAVPVFDDYKKYVDEDLRQFIEGLLREYTFEKCVLGYEVHRLRV